MVWKYGNPVQIEFGVDSFAKLAELIGGRRYALVTYGEPFFDELAGRLKETAGAPALVISDVAPNPDYRLLAEQTGRFAKLERQPEVIVALGGGSVIDSAKVFAAAGATSEKSKPSWKARKAPSSSRPFPSSRFRRRQAPEAK